VWADRGPCSIALVPVRLHVNEKRSQVATDTYPNALHVERNTIGGNALVVSGFENVVFPSLVCKATTQPVDIGLKCVRLEKLVGESRE